MQGRETVLHGQGSKQEREGERKKKKNRTEEKRRNVFLRKHHDMFKSEGEKCGLFSPHTREAWHVRFTRRERSWD